MFNLFTKGRFLALLALASFGADEFTLTGNGVLL